jgi:hypothetical protein
MPFIPAPPGAKFSQGSFFETLADIAPILREAYVEGRRYAEQRDIQLRKTEADILTQQAQIDAFIGNLNTAQAQLAAQHNLDPTELESHFAPLRQQLESRRAEYDKLLTRRTPRGTASEPPTTTATGTPASPPAVEPPTAQPTRGALGTVTPLKVKTQVESQQLRNEAARLQLDVTKADMGRQYQLSSEGKPIRRFEPWEEMRNTFQSLQSNLGSDIKGPDGTSIFSYADASGSSPRIAAAADLAPRDWTLDPRAQPYATIITDAANRHGIDPALLAATADAESSFNPTAHNPEGDAHGMFQITRATAARYGVTDPAQLRDPSVAADVAARIIADNKSMAGEQGTVEDLATLYHAGTLTGAANGPKTQDYAGRVARKYRSFGGTQYPSESPATNPYGTPAAVARDLLQSTDFPSFATFTRMAPSEQAKLLYLGMTYGNFELDRRYKEGMLAQWNKSNPRSTPIERERARVLTALDRGTKLLAPYLDAGGGLIASKIDPNMTTTERDIPPAALIEHLYGTGSMDPVDVQRGIDNLNRLALKGDATTDVSGGDIQNLKVLTIDENGKGVWSTAMDSKAILGGTTPQFIDGILKWRAAVNKALPYYRLLVDAETIDPALTPFVDQMIGHPLTLALLMRLKGPKRVEEARVRFGSVSTEIQKFLQGASISAELGEGVSARANEDAMLGPDNARQLEEMLRGQGLDALLPGGLAPDDRNAIYKNLQDLQNQLNDLPSE